MEQNPSPNPNPTSNPTSPSDPLHPSDPQQQKPGGILGGRRKQAKPQRKTGEPMLFHNSLGVAPLCRLRRRPSEALPVKETPDRSTPTTDNTLREAYLTPAPFQKGEFQAVLENFTLL